MKINFDEITDRSHTDCVKYDLCERYFGEKNLIPAWIADTDFKVAECIKTKLMETVEHQILGYTYRGDAYLESIISWYKQRHNTTILKEWLTHSSGVVPGIVAAILTFTAVGDEIIIQPPVYPPFFSTVKDNHRKLVENPLSYVNGRYEMDFKDLEEKITDKTKLLILCSPHNPTGRVWSKADLEKLAALCIKHKIMVVSDEIHSDLVYKPHVHTPMCALSEAFNDHLILLGAPSKTFNVAGLFTSYGIIPNTNNRKAFIATLERLAINNANIFGMRALQAAYESGTDYLNDLLDYLKGNIEFIEKFIQDNSMKIKFIKPDATFLAWLDFSAYNLSQEELMHKILVEAKVGIQSGEIFGKQEGNQFVRFNFGTQRVVVEKILNALKCSFDNL